MKHVAGVVTAHWKFAASFADLNIRLYILSSNDTMLMSLLHHSSLWLSFKTISCTNNSYKMHEWIFRKCCVHISIHPRAMLHVNVYLSEALWRSFSHWLHCAAASVTSWLELRADECKEVQCQAFYRACLLSLWSEQHLWRHLDPSGTSLSLWCTLPPAIRRVRVGVHLHSSVI